MRFVSMYNFIKKKHQINNKIKLTLEKNQIKINTDIESRKVWDLKFNKMNGNAD